MIINRNLSLICFLCLASPSAFANTINFEDLTDMEVVGSHYPGLTFSDALALQAGFSLNEFEFPPHSGDIAVTNSANSLTITFDGVISNFTAYFTYSNTLKLFAYDSNTLLMSSLQSTYNNNSGLSGDIGSATNELISFSLNGIKSIIIGSSVESPFAFVMDDVSYTSISPPISPVPLPNPFVLFLSALALMSFLFRYKTTML